MNFRGPRFVEYSSGIGRIYSTSGKDGDAAVGLTYQPVQHGNALFGSGCLA